MSLFSRRKTILSKYFALPSDAFELFVFTNYLSFYPLLFSRSVEKKELLNLNSSINKFMFLYVKSELGIDLRKRAKNILNSSNPYELLNKHITSFSRFGYFDKCDFYSPKSIRNNYLNLEKKFFLSLKRFITLKSKGEGEDELNSLKKEISVIFSTLYLYKILLNFGNKGEIEKNIGNLLIKKSRLSSIIELTMHSLIYSSLISLAITYSLAFLLAYPFSQKTNKMLKEAIKDNTKRTNFYESIITPSNIKHTPNLYYSEMSEEAYNKLIFSLKDRLGKNYFLLLRLHKITLESKERGDKHLYSSLRKFEDAIFILSSVFSNRESQKSLDMLFQEVDVIIKFYDKKGYGKLRTKNIFPSSPITGSLYKLRPKKFISYLSSIGINREDLIKAIYFCKYSSSRYVYVGLEDYNKLLSSSLLKLKEILTPN